MNKKVKFLSSIICGLAVSSTITFANVHAQTTNTNFSSKETIVKSTDNTMKSGLIQHPVHQVRSPMSVNAVQSEDYSAYYYMNKADSDKVVDEFNKGTIKNVDDLKNFLLKGTIRDKVVARTISNSLFQFCENEIFENAIGSNGVIFLRSAKTPDKFTITHSEGPINDFGYTNYYSLSDAAVRKIIAYCDSRPQRNRDEFMNFLVEGNIMSREVANNIGPNLWWTDMRIFYNCNDGNGLMALRSIEHPDTFIITPTLH